MIRWVDAAAVWTPTATSHQSCHHSPSRLANPPTCWDTTLIGGYLFDFHEKEDGDLQVILGDGSKPMITIFEGPAIKPPL